MNDKALNILEFNKIKEKLKEYTQTSAAKDIIDGLKPYSNMYDVEEHLEETKEAYKILTKKGEPPFEGIYDVRDAVNLASKGFTLKPGQLLKIVSMLRCARRFKSYLSHKEDEESYKVLEDICEGICPLKKAEDEIFFAIVSEDEVSDKASSELFNIRRSLKDKNASVKEKVNSLIRNYSKYLQENLYTIRGDRYVIPVKAEYKSLVPGLIHDQSSSGATLFIEPMGLVNLNNDIKELMLKEKAEIERILSKLSSMIYESIIAVRNNENIVWELDFIFAKAKYASDINGTCPSINNEGIIDIVEARHPLIDPKCVVPIDVYLGRDFTSLVITGPNTGGKTVTLKTVGLIHIMALSGLMIPVRENSTISFFNEVFADIGDEQSIEQSLSTFSSHMTNIVEIMGKADEKSLVLFDELGAGTDPTEGAALAVAILENLKKRNVKIIATTHYSELKVYAMKTQGVENASVEFDVETLSPTYRLLIGLPGKSNAFEISKRLGLPQYIVDDAKQNIANDTLQFEDLIQSLQDKTVKAEKDARDIQVIKNETLEFKKKYEEKLYSFEKNKANVLAQAQREAKRIIKEAKNETDETLKNIKQLEKIGYSSETRQKIEMERKRLKEKLEKTEESSDAFLINNGEELKSVTLGEEVFLPSLNQKVTVLTHPDNKGEVQVQAGIMKISVNVKDLRKTKKSDTPKNRVRKREAKLNLRSVSSSVDLRGMDSEEAKFTTDKYLDDAYVAGLGEVTIIHGKGTGVLRKSITDMLKRHPHVKNFRLGEYGEGGSGVTVVVLK